MTARLVVYADKTVLRIRGVDIKGLKPADLEAALTARLRTPVRLIGVAGHALDLDVYGLDAEQILRDEAGVIHAVSAVPGIHASQLTQIESAEKVVTVDMDRIRDTPAAGCRKERWTPPHGTSHSDPDRG